MAIRFIIYMFRRFALFILILMDMDTIQIYAIIPTPSLLNFSMTNTFGSSKAAQTLEVLVNDIPNARRRVSRLLSKFTHKLLHVTSARDPETVLTCMELLREQTLKNIDTMKNVNPAIRSYTKNVVTHRYRAFRSGFESLIPHLGKKD